MISFRSFSLVMSVLLLRQVVLQSDSDSTSDFLVGVHPFNWLIGGTVLFCVISKFLPVAAMIRADSVGRAQGWREMEQNRNWLEWTWLVAQSWLLTNSAAARTLASAEHAGWSPALMIVAWFLPTIVFFSALEFGFTQLECLWSADGDQSSMAHWKRWSARVRLGALGNVITCLVPVAILFGSVDLIHYTLPALSEFLRASLALLCLGIVGLTFAPLWLRVWMGARPLASDHALRERVGYFGTCMKVPAPQVCTVGPGQTWHGIALVGWTPLFRQLWVGASVPQGLTAEQLDMVVLHELAHLKRGHCWWRIIPLLIAGIACVIAVLNWPLSYDLGVRQLVVSLAFAIGMVWMLSFISKACELDADRQACFYAAQHCAWTDGQPTRAMSTLAGALVALHDPNRNPTQAQWLHPSLAKRIAIKP